MSSVKVYYREVEFDVEYDFQPEEPADNEYPGCGMEITPTFIECKGVDFWVFFTEFGTKEEIRKVLQDFTDLIIEAIPNK